MTVHLRVEGDNAGDELRDLYAWLGEEPELRGRVRIVEAPPEPGALGAAPGLLNLLLGAGGGLATAATVLVAWLGTRRGEVSVKAGRGDRSVELTAKGVKALDAAAARDLAEQVVRLLEEPPPTPLP
ncbi:effector-associated constant component EACC1 [[Actinomadura] parvosata]|uniref:effector-associated constant component EACC1 n=1 Tax=[Actinomadura] parvosata TaxID=1955412 RepID=UPI00406D29A7